MILDPNALVGQSNSERNNDNRIDLPGQPEWELLLRYHYTKRITNDHDQRYDLAVIVASLHCVSAGRKDSQCREADAGGRDRHRNLTGKVLFSPVLEHDEKVEPFYRDSIMPHALQVLLRLRNTMAYHKTHASHLFCSLVFAVLILSSAAEDHAHPKVEEEAHAGGRFDKNVVHDKDHIMEHLEGVVQKPEAEMSPQELQLHYFKMHDYDGNNLLDGLELATAISHVHRERKRKKKNKLHTYILASVLSGAAVLSARCAYTVQRRTAPGDRHRKGNNDNTQTISEPELIAMIDDVLRDDDMNNDGFIDYAEFAKSMQ
ncbi:unnamed protein product [Ranitomeya imitator]|uniref:EF-hand domain-containing protein n=1 Tax=Ranitomeya imitator TaxID=111125 RepID=A0ABN9MJN1_9NEOB|nr:unnamed protein product [Ranitomeya imitator]